MSAGTSPDIQGHARLCGCAACLAQGAGASAGPQSSVTVTLVNGGGTLLSFSGNGYIDALLSEPGFRWNSNAPGTPLTISYGFMTTMPWYAASWGNESGPFQAFTAAQRDGVHRAVALFEQVCNVDFVFRADGDNAQVRFGSAVLDSWEAAHTYYPDPVGDWAGDVWFNSQEASVYNQNAGTYGFMVTLHEMGHALGLKHPFEGLQLPYGQDNRQYTVMSYNAPASMPDLEPSSLMLYDIAALQYLYGANTSYASGDTRWSWGANQSFRFCIWDGGGNDTIDASNQTRRVIIDLNPGTFSSLGSYRGGDIVDNLSIAFNAWIENAIGGSGNDRIIGSEIANRLEGGAGNDTIFGGGGDDSLFGGSGNDSFNGGGGADLIDGGAGFDVISFAESTVGASAADITQDTLVGIEQIVGSDYGDVLVAHSGVTWVVGGYGHDTLISSSSGDRLDGGDGWDAASYANSNAAVTINLATGFLSGGDAAGDTLISIESLVGSAFDDVLTGDATANHLTGGAGNDILDGGAGLDSYFGGAGDDIFIIDTPPLNNSAGEDYYVFENVGEGIDEIRTTANRTSAFLRDNVENLTFIGIGSFEASGNNLDNRLTGGAGNDKLTGWYGNDVLVGGDGDDLLIGGEGGDTLIGGGGFDTVAYYDSAPVRVDLAGGANAGQAVGDTFSGIEKVVGSRSYADHFLGDGGDNIFEGLGGNDIIDGRGGNDTAVYTGTARDYEITEVGGVTTVRPLRGTLTYAEGIDTLTSIETILFTGANANNAPVVLAAAGAYRNTAQRFDVLLTVNDADFLDSVLRYEVRDLTAGGGNFTYNGVTLAPNQTISLTSAEMVNFLYHSEGAVGVSDQVAVRVQDGVDWSVWTTLTLTTVNRAPFSATFSQSPSHGTAFVAASSLVSASDADGDPVIRYEFVDNTPGGGYFRLNGAQLPQTFQVSTADFQNLHFVPALGPGMADYLQVRAYDGYSWGDWRPIFVDPAPNATPIVTVGSITAPRGVASVAASTLFSVVDSDGDAMTRYRFYDDRTGNGHFALNGVQQASLANIEIAAAQLADMRFVLGAPGTSDLLWVQTHDGYVWSAWKSFTVTAPQNVAPVVSAAPSTSPGHGMLSMAASTLFSVTDANGDAITHYRFYDGTVGNGRFRLNGALQAEMANIEIAAANLAHFDFKTSGTGPDVLWVQAYDGYAWGTWKSFTVAAVPNVVAVVTVANKTPAHGQQSLAGSSLFSTFDADGDTITHYRFYDGTVGNGRFRLNGALQAEMANIEIAAGDLAHFDFKTSGAGSDVLWLQAYDGYAWGAWKSFTVAAVPNVLPVVTVANKTPAHGQQSLAGSSLFSTFDADGDTITHYRFYDGTVGNGRFRLNGVLQTEMANIEIAAGDLANFDFKTSGTGSDVLWVQAYDGYGWGLWKSFTAAAVPNKAPVVTVANLAPARGTAAIAGSSLYATLGDGDGDAITHFRFYDGTVGNGRFRLNGVLQAEMANIEIAAADLAGFDFKTSAAGSDLLWVQAYDGFAWGAWKSFAVAATPNTAPVVTVADFVPSQGDTSIPAADLFAVTDADGDTITHYRFYDDTVGNGRFRLNGVLQAEKANVEIAAADIDDFDFRSGAGSDLLWVQAYDGHAWGAWKSFTAGAPQGAAPQVIVQDRTPAHGTTSIAAADLFAVSAPDGASITHYRFYDDTVGNGRFQISSVDQLEDANITVTAAGLAGLSFRTGVGSDLLWVQASADNMATWGAWKSFIVNAPLNAVPVVSVANFTPHVGTTSIAASTLFSVSDADSDAITRYRFFDDTLGNGRFVLGGANQVEDGNIEVTHAQLAALTFRPGTAGGDLLWVQAFDGKGWGAWKSFTVNPPQEVAPTVAVGNHAVAPNAVLAAAKLLSAADLNKDAITQYEFWDSTAGGGEFRISGVAQGVNQSILVMANQLAATDFRAGSGAGSDLLWARASDGTSWGTWQSFTVTTLAA